MNFAQLPAWELVTPLRIRRHPHNDQLLCAWVSGCHWTVWGPTWDNRAAGSDPNECVRGVAGNERLAIEAADDALESMYDPGRLMTDLRTALADLQRTVGLPPD